MIEKTDQQLHIEMDELANAIEAADVNHRFTSEVSALIDIDAAGGWANARAALEELLRKVEAEYEE